MQAFTLKPANTIMLAAAGVFLSVATAAADTVNISADDGNVKVSGQITLVLDRSITVKTDVGLLTFNIDAIQCEGFGCPRVSLDNVQPTSSATK